MSRASSGARHDLSLPKGLSRDDTEHPRCDEPALSPTTWSAKPAINVGRAPETSLVALVHVPTPISDGVTALIEGDAQHQSRDPGYRGDRGRFPQALTHQAIFEAGLGPQGRGGGQQSTASWTGTAVRSTCHCPFPAPCAAAKRADSTTRRLSPPCATATRARGGCRRTSSSSAPKHIGVSPVRDTLVPVKGGTFSSRASSRM